MQAKRLLGIEISDLGVTAARLRDNGAELIRLDGESVELSSFAQLTGKGEVVFGSSAFRQFLTSEVPVDNQFWYRLATLKDPSAAKGRSKHQPADSELAQAHLAAVFEKCLQTENSFDEVVVAIPGHFKSSKLGSLIQITRAIGIPVHHVVDSALASLLSAAAVPESESLVVADLHWNTAEVVHVGRASTGIERLNVAEDRGLGLRQILDRLVDGLGKRFIDECRFDPAARPDYAQELYNQLLAYLSDLDGDSACKIETAKGSITVDRIGLAAMIEKELQSLSDLIGRAMSPAGSEQQSVLFLTSRLRLVPGLKTLLEKIHSSVLSFETGEAATGALAFLNALEGDVTPDQPLFHSEVEFAKPADPAAASDTGKKIEGTIYVSGTSGILKPTAATHLLFQGRILLLPQFGDADFAIGKGASITSGLAVVEPVEKLAETHVLLKRQEDGSLEMVNNGRNLTWVNGKEVAPNSTVVIQTGDVVTLGDSILQVMVVGLVSNDA